MSIYCACCEGHEAQDSAVDHLETQSPAPRSCHDDAFNAQLNKADDACHKYMICWDSTQDWYPETSLVCLVAQPMQRR